MKTIKLKILLLLSAVLLGTIASLAQISRTTTEFKIDSLLPINTNRVITPARLQQSFRKVLDYVQPSNFSTQSINLSKLSASGATINQVPKWNGTAWIPSNDLVGSGGGGATWGSIPGTLSDQTDLQAALLSKFNVADTTIFLRKTTAAALYQPKGSYLTTSSAAATYQPIGSYLTSINSGQVTTALGFTPYNSTNPSGYITSSALSPYLTSATAASTYQPIGSYLTAASITGKLNISDTTSLLQKVTASALYQPKGSYLTTINLGQVTNALGFTPYNATNPNGYITAADITGKQDVITAGSVNLDKINQSGATINQVPKWNGTAWVPSTDLVGSGGGGATWGSIPGTLSDQTDLQAALNLKLNISDTTGLLKKVTASALYQPKGSYLTTSSAAATYQPIGSYLTSINSGQVTTALGFTPYNSTNPSGFITSSALSPYLTSATAASTYQPIGSYLTASSITGKLNISDTTSLLQKLTASALYQPKGSYLTTSAAAATYQPIGSYLTSINSSQVTTALGFTPYNATNPNGYITASAITGKQDVITAGSVNLDKLNQSGAATGNTITWNGTAWVATTPDILVFSRQTSNYTLIASDAGRLVDMNLASANTITVPPNISVAFPIGTQILVSSYGTGQTTIVAGAGVSLRSAGNKLKLSAQYSGGTLVKIGTNEWYVFGDFTN